MSTRKHDINVQYLYDNVNSSENKKKCLNIPKKVFGCAQHLKAGQNMEQLCSIKKIKMLSKYLIILHLKAGLFNYFDIKN